jgi:hypothetical protein
MDALTLAMAKKAAAGDAAQALADAKEYSNENLQTAKDYTDESIPVCEEGQTTLTNTQKYPFNNSVKSVALVKEQVNTKYTVTPEIVSAVGNPGEIVVSEKQVNGFKLAFTGSASSVVVKYIVIGGIIA